MNKAEKKQIKKQQTFVKFLQSHGIYNKFESAATMNKLMAVWECAQKDFSDELKSMVV